MKMTKLAVASVTALMMFADVRRNKMNNPKKSLPVCFQEFRDAYGADVDDYDNETCRNDYYVILKRMIGKA